MIYVFVQPLTQNNMLVAPTIFMFFSGVIKYAERTISFYFASAHKFKSSILSNLDPRMNYSGYLEDDSLMKEVALEYEAQNPESDAEKSGLIEIEVVQRAYYFFNKFKGLAVDMVFTRKIRNESRNFFLKQTAKDAFKVVEVEFNLFYEALFTKLPVVYGYIRFGTRIFSFVMVCTSTGLFKIEDKSKFKSNIDVNITYALLLGALALDIRAVFVLMLSNKTIDFLSKRSTPGNNSLWTRILTVILTCNVSGILKGPNEEIPIQKNEPQTHVSPLIFFKRRWCESVPTDNLVSYCIHSRSKYKQLIYDKLGLTTFLDIYKYAKAKRFTTKLRDFIFEELKSKFEDADDFDTAINICSSRGDKVLQIEDDWSSLHPYTLDKDFGQRIILWHIAIDLCYSKELELRNKFNSKIHENNKDYRDMAKLLSDYMMFILVMKPTMMTTVTSSVQIQFWEMCTNAKDIFGDEVLQNSRQGTNKSEVYWEHFNACMKILRDSERVKNMGRDETKHLIDNSILLANEVMKLEDEYYDMNKWLMINKVWVDLLCYGASHSQAKMQTAQLSKGGDLITIVWLLMAHLGLGDQFQSQQDKTRAKCVVG